MTDEPQNRPFADYSLKVCNFKCFAEDMQGFDTIAPINLIIGRNNSGKSTLLDLIEYSAHPERGIGSALRHKGKIPNVAVSWVMTQDELESRVDQGFMYIKQGNGEWTLDPRTWAAANLTGKRATFLITNPKSLTFDKVADYELRNDGRDEKRLEIAMVRFAHNSPNPFTDCRVRRILADRDIVPEGIAKDDQKVLPNGQGLTGVIASFLNDDHRDSSLVEDVLVRHLNSIFSPDAHFTRLLVQRRRNEGNWEIHLEEEKKGRIPLSQTGSGFKTVVLVLANLIINPVVDNDLENLSKYFFCLEELENNLHPAIQRRLFKYLRDYAKKHGCHFAITTHSNVVIDMFSKDEMAQIIHVTHDNGESKAESVGDYLSRRNVLDDLDVRASDLLQTNAVVWVEGPSDRIYFNKWIELWDADLVEGIEYQVLTYGGSVNAHFSFDDPDHVDELIAALKINAHAVLIADSDKKTDEDELKMHTARVTSELKQMNGHAWITAGKEVENYIPIDAFRLLLGDQALTGPKKFSNAIDYYTTKAGRVSIKKVELATKVIEHLTREQLLTTQDLSDRLSEVCNHIRKWNGLETREYPNNMTK